MFNLLRRTVKTPGSHVTGQVEERSRSVPKSSTVQNDGRRIQVRVVPEALAFAESGACAAAVGMLDPGHEPPRLDSTMTGPFLLQRAYDAAAHAPGRPAPSEEQISHVLDLSRRIAAGGGGRILFFCAQGVSRSPALALVALADGFGPGLEEEAFAALAAGCRFPQVIDPNRLLLRLGDEMLGRGGALIAATRDGLARLRA